MDCSEINPAYHLLAVKHKTVGQLSLIAMEMGEAPDDQRDNRLVKSVSPNQGPSFFADSRSLYAIAKTA